MMGMTLTGLTLVISFAVQVLSIGMFQVSIMAIYNYRGQKDNGRCCDGSQDRPPCTMECRTFFSICILHYITDVPDTPSCPFGHTLTPVLGGNSINETALAVLNYFPLKIPFSYAWPGSFTLVIDVVHDAFHNRTLTDPTQRILRSVVIDSLYPPTVWKRETMVSESVDLFFNYRILCDENYYGPECNVICRPRNDNLGHYLCDENGTKICLPGWEGEHCQRALCLDTCNKTNGICEEPFTCRCIMGWTGESCDQCLTHSKCMNGYCLQPSQCICLGGWRGEYCNIDTNYCMKTQPCLNGGTCIFDLKLNYTCVCPLNFTGVHCDAHLCHNEFCENGGHCQDEDHGPTCTCSAGYHGSRCEHPVPTCDEIECKNNGTCMMNEFGATCDCEASFEGKRCEMFINPCDSLPCKNGKCLNKGSTYTCSCEEGYKGDNCDRTVDLCDDYPCFNGGTCFLDSSSKLPVCACADHYTGHDCQIINNLCVNDRCQNGGSCKGTQSYFKCVCTDGYSGIHCEQKQDLCQNVMCKNGGICKHFENSTKCVCDPDYGGRLCEVPLLQSDQSATHPTLGDRDRDMGYVNSGLALRYTNFSTMVVTLVMIYFCISVKL
ncbi:delta-like protein 1 isoform X1 [Mizuhopecten yessoensis]|uniref:delta-like protein 1 isoform X1 n=1 Tax=Mizuhopecten yessoensis TaxID=6573 RepID=UPI000B45C188|nr:delta-like protein 1 isoform X1 [Mizuhopecten yessoensis]XP_021356595.1 delta-like protein 1 isoform X1 [Mizuhopecten yessoensis]